MEHKHSVFDTDTHFVIDPVSRAIKIGENTKTTLVQTDHNSEVYTFDIPKIIDGHDMMLCNLVEVHYDNIDSATKEKSRGFYKVEDMKVSETNPEMLCFTWLIKEPATKFVGKIEFSIKFKCIEDGKLLYRWNTIKNKDLTVEASNDNSEVATEEPYPDIIAQWEESLFGIGDTEEQRLIDESTAQQAAIAAKGEEVLEEAEAQKNAVTARGEAVKASIPADYSALSALADHNRRNKAGAIVLEAQGESIVLNDSSEYPVTGLKVFGKSTQFATTGRNLLDVEESIDLTNVLGVDVSLPAGEYVVTLTSETHSGDQAPHLRFYTNNVWVQLKAGLRQNVVLSQDENMVYIYTYGMSAAESVGVEASLNQLMISTDGGEYEPYTGGIASPYPDYPQEINSVENPVVDGYGRNLLNLDEFKKVGGYRATVAFNDDVLEITATENDGFNHYSAEMFPAGARIHARPGTMLTLSWETDAVAGNGGHVFVFMHGGDNIRNRSALASARSLTFEVLDKTEFITFRFGADLADTTVRYWNLQMEVGDKSTEYEPYRGQQTVTIPHTLPGIPVSSGGNYTDADGQQWICDEVDLARGVYVQRIHSVTFSDFSNSKAHVILNGHTEGSVFAGVNFVEPRKALCSHFVNSVSGDTVRFAVLENGGIYFNLKGEHSQEEWRNVMERLSPTVCGILATPVETPLTDAEITAYKALCTNKPNTTILNDSGAYMAVEYVADTKTYIDNKIAELMAQ